MQKAAQTIFSVDYLSPPPPPLKTSYHARQACWFSEKLQGGYNDRGGSVGERRSLPNRPWTAHSLNQKLDPMKDTMTEEQPDSFPR